MLERRGKRPCRIVVLGVLFAASVAWAGEPPRSVEPLQPPIDIGPCPDDSTKVCWRIRTLTDSAPIVAEEEDSCLLRDDLYSFNIDYFKVVVTKNGSPYQAIFATYLLKPTVNASFVESVTVQRENKKLRWSMSGCPKLKECEHEPGTIMKNCRPNSGIPKGSQGELVGSVFAIFELGANADQCPDGTTAVAGNARQCQGPVYGIELKGKKK